MDIASRSPSGIELPTTATPSALLAVEINAMKPKNMINVTIDRLQRSLARAEARLRKRGSPMISCVRSRLTCSMRSSSGGVDSARASFHGVNPAAANDASAEVRRLFANLLDARFLATEHQRFREASQG